MAVSDRPRRRLRRPARAGPHEDVRESRARRKCRSSPALPADLDFVLALHEASVVGIATGYALGQSRAGARAPAHDRRARQRRRRACDGARQPGAARRARRAAGSPAPRARAVPHGAARRARGRLSRSGSTSPFARRTSRARSAAPGTRRRPRAALRSSSCRWTTGLRPRRCRRTARRRRRRPTCAGGGSCRRRRDRRDARGRAAPGDRRRRRRRRARDLGGARRAGGEARRTRPGRSPSAPAPGSRRITRSSQGTFPLIDRGCVRRSQPYDVVLVRRRRRRFASTRTPRVRSTAPGTRVAVVTEDPAEAHRSAAELAVIAPVRAVCAALARRLRARERAARTSRREPPLAAVAHNPLRATNVFDGPRERLVPGRGRHRGVPVEPSRAPRAHSRAGAARVPEPGDGRPRVRASRRRSACAWRYRSDPSSRSSGTGRRMYSIQALWSAAHYRVGALFVVLANGGYAIMDRLAETQGDAAPWPQLTGIDIAGLARAFGCPAETHHDAGGARRARSTRSFRSSPNGTSRSSSRSRSLRTRRSSRDRDEDRRTVNPSTTERARFTQPRGTSSQQIAKEIRRYIVQQRLQPDDRLGTETELATEFGVSRPTLREALRLLASSHLIRATRGPGGGVFVASTENEGIGPATSASPSRRCSRPRACLCSSSSRRASISRCRSRDWPPERDRRDRRRAGAGDRERPRAPPGLGRVPSRRCTLPPRHRADRRERAPPRVHELDARRPAAAPRRAGRRRRSTATSSSASTETSCARSGSSQPVAAQRAMRRHLEYVLERTRAVE